jgi:hypothetical protein
MATGAVTEYDADTGSATATLFSGQFVPQTRVLVTFTTPSATETFPDTFAYRNTYDQAPTAANLTGQFFVVQQMGGNVAGNLVVDGTGTMSGTFGNCNISGTAVPDSSGKNFYRVNATLAATSSAAACPLEGKAATGVIAPYPAVGSDYFSAVLKAQDGSMAMAALIEKH